MTVFFLTKNQEKVFISMPHDGDSVTGIADRAKLPRTSVGKALDKLQEIGLVYSRKVRDKNKHIYYKVSAEELVRKTDEAKNILLGKKFQGNVSIPHGTGGSISIHRGKEAILAIIYKIVSLHQGDRVYVLQGTNTPAEWLKLIGHEEALKINDTFNKNGLLWIGLRSESFLTEFKKKSLEKNYKGRVGDVHILPDHCFEELVATYLFKGTVLFVDLENVLAVEINDKKIVSLLKKIFTHLLKVAPRQHLE